MRNQTFVHQTRHSSAAGVQLLGPYLPCSVWQGMASPSGWKHRACVATSPRLRMSATAVSGICAARSRRLARGVICAAGRHCGRQCRQLLRPELLRAEPSWASTAATPVQVMVFSKLCMASTIPRCSSITFAIPPRLYGTAGRAFLSRLVTTRSMILMGCRSA